MLIHLPKDPTRLADAVHLIINKGRTTRNPLAVEWYLNFWYLQGVRNFNVVSWQTGRVQMAWESTQGQLKFRYEDVLEQYNRELGLLLGVDTLPNVKPRKQLHLDGARKSAIAQVYLDDATGPIDNEQIKVDFMEGILQFGTMGLIAEEGGDVGLDYGGGAMIRTVPPWQLIPIPSRPTRRADVMGAIRHYWVPYRWLRATQSIRLKFPRKDSPDGELDGKLDARWTEPGEKQTDTDDTDMYGDADAAGLADPSRSGIGGPMPAKGGSGEPYVELIQLWIDDGTGVVDRHVVAIGRHIAFDATYTDIPRGKRPRMPLGVGRRAHSGGFYGRSFVGPLLSINNEVERMYSRLFKNVQEADQFPLILLPANSGIKKQHLTSTSTPRVAFYEHDYMGMPFKAEAIQPVNSRDFPGRVAATGVQLMDRQSHNSELYSGQAPGRVDSASGLGLLHETAGVSRKAMITSVNSAYARVYACMLRKGNSMMESNALRQLRLTTVDHHVAGIAINGDTGQIDLAQNPLPDPDEVRISIKQMEPRLLAKEKEELVLMLKLGIIDPTEFRWLNHSKGLGFNAGNLAEINQRELAMWRNIIQFNDGKTPGAVTAGTLDMHQVQLRAIREFISLPIYALSTVEVQSKFEERLQFHEAALAGFPEQLPYPENAGRGGGAPAPTGLPEFLQKDVASLNKKAALGEAAEQLGAAGNRGGESAPR